MDQSTPIKNIFSKEEQVVIQAEELLATNNFQIIKDEEFYRSLLKEYKNLLKQMKRMVKISDIMQLELKNMSFKLEVASQTDVLTGLYNRRFFNEVYLNEWKNAVRNQTSIALLMIDIDYFKKYNDTYGHLQGDECLAAVAREIQQTVKRPRDVVARFGGEEFVALLPETGIEGASFVAQALLSAINRLDLAHTGSLVNTSVTVSVGVVAIVPDEKITMDDFLNMSDTALYTAKNDGRNCFRVYI